MNLLLDTHIALWALTDSPALPQGARDAILTQENDVFVSDISAWEVAVKSVARPGLLPCSTAQFLEKCSESGYHFLPLSHEAIVAYTKLNYDKAGGTHKDPFDRMLIAQAKSAGMLLITHDATLAAYGEASVSVV